MEMMQNRFSQLFAEKVISEIEAVVYIPHHPRQEEIFWIQFCADGNLDADTPFFLQYNYPHNSPKIVSQKHFEIKQILHKYCQKDL